MDAVLEKTEVKPQRIHRLNRRSAFKVAGALGLGALGFEVIDKLGDTPERTINPAIIAREKQDDMGLGELWKRRSEYFAMWPYSRAWVVVNNLLAAQKLDGQTFKKDQEYSLINLIGLDQNYEGNFDPEKGYVTGVPVHPYFPFLSFDESHGVSLTATVFARAAALSPIGISEWNTHASADDSIMKYYFDSKFQFTGSKFFQRIGTDATLFTGNGINFDFRFTPKTDLKFRYKVMDINGKPINVPEVLDLIKGYSKSPFMALTTPILLRAAFGSNEEVNSTVSFTNTVSQEYDGRYRPGFVRELKIGDETPTREKFQALYDTNGIYMP